MRQGSRAPGSDTGSCSGVAEGSSPEPAGEDSRGGSWLVDAFRSMRVGTISGGGGPAGRHRSAVGRSSSVGSGAAQGARSSVPGGSTSGGLDTSEGPQLRQSASEAGSDDSNEVTSPMRGPQGAPLNCAISLCLLRILEHRLQWFVYNPSSYNTLDKLDIEHLINLSTIYVPTNFLGTTFVRAEILVAPPVRWLQAATTSHLNSALLLRSLQLS